MLELNNALELILKGIEAPLSEYGFKVEYPEGVRPPELPIAEEGNKSIIMYRGENGRVRLEHENGKLALFCARTDEEDTPDDDMRRISLSLLDLETFNEKDAKYICHEYVESFEKAYRNFMTEFDDLELELNPQNLRNTLESVKVIKNVYNIILYISITISSVMLVNIIIYVERKQKNDTMISYSLGNSRMAIISSKFLTYLVISLPSLLTGGIISFFISNSLMNKIIHNNAMIQEKYLKYANNGVAYKKIADITIENIKLSDLPQSMMICSVIIVTMILLTVVPVIMISLSNDEIRRVND